MKSQGFSLNRILLAGIKQNMKLLARLEHNHSNGFEH